MFYLSGEIPQPITVLTEYLTGYVMEMEVFVWNFGKDLQSWSEISGIISAEH